MKNFKRILSMALALLMVAALAMTAFAADGTPTEPSGETPLEEPAPAMQGPAFFDEAQTDTNNSGKITISDAAPNEEYNLYQILYIESFKAPAAGETDDDGNPSGGNYAYKANTYWEDFINSTSNPAIKGRFVSVDENGAVKWTGSTGTQGDVVEFAKLAIAYAKANNIPKVETITAEQLFEIEYQKNEDGSFLVDKDGEKVPVMITDPNDSTKTIPKKIPLTYSSVVFDDLKLGYYLIDTTLGSLCSLDTTNKVITMQEKNEVPKNEKKVQEDSKNNQYFSENTADIGQTVYYRSTIENITNGTNNIVFHDEMTTGLTFLPESVDVSLSGATPLVKYTEGATEYDYKVITPTAPNTKLSDNCTFEIEFSPSFYTSASRLGTVGTYTITVTYQAKVNTEAKVGVEGNPNTSKISYGEKSHPSTTPPSKTITKTYGFPVFKYEMKNGSKSGLDSTHFKLSTRTNLRETSKVETFISFIKEESKTTSEGKAVDVYRRATPEEIENNELVTDPTTANVGDLVDEIVTNSDGRFAIVGLDADTYYLTETLAKPGYAELKEAVTVVVNEDGTIQKYNKTATVIEIQNGTGDELPSTGGIGTTIFYVVGSVLLVGAGVLLVTKRRMSESK